MATFPVAYVGMPITADFWNSGQEDFYSKGQDLVRGSQTTVDFDPELVGMPLVVGTYTVATRLLFSNDASGAGGKLKYAFSFTGTATGVRLIQGVDADNGTTTSQFYNGTAHSQTSNTKHFLKSGQTAAGVGLTTQVSTSSNDAYPISFFDDMIITVTVAGTLSLVWAQVTSVANGIKLWAGTSMTIKRRS